MTKEEEMLAEAKKAIGQKSYNPGRIEILLGCDIKDCRKKAVVFDTPHNLCEEHKNLFDSENGTARWIGWMEKK